MNTHYITVFDMSTKTVDWHMPAAGIPFLIVGAIAIWVAKRKNWTGLRRWNGYFFVGFSIFWMFIAFRVGFWDYSLLHRAYQNGDVSVVEGEVENFRPMPYQGHPEECFSVKDATFCYSDYKPTAGFNNSASHGGPIRSGLPVRITYVGNHILRIEVREGWAPSLAERQATKSAAEAEWKDRQERDPGLDKMNLGFAVAATFLSSWWTLSWRRFMKFWVKPPNRRATIIGIRLFFLASLIGSIWGLVSQIAHHPRPARAYFDAFKIGALWIVAMIVMVHFAEWWRGHEANNEPNVAH
jgi:hypothetical protein